MYLIVYFYSNINLYYFICYRNSFIYINVTVRQKCRFFETQQIVVVRWIIAVQWCHGMLVSGNQLTVFFVFTILRLFWHFTMCYHNHLLLIFKLFCSNFKIFTNDVLSCPALLFNFFGSSTLQNWLAELKSLCSIDTKLVYYCHYVT